MEFVILSVNGVTCSHEEAVAALGRAKQPLTVQVSPRPAPGSDPGLPLRDTLFNGRNRND